MTKRGPAILALLVGVVVGACSPPEVTLFNQSFLNLFTGSIVPIAPGPDSGYVMVMVVNNTANSIEFVVTAEQEEILVNLDSFGNFLSLGESRLLEARTVDLVTDVDAPTLAIVFDQTPVDFPTVGPGEISGEDARNIINQLRARNEEDLIDRDFIRLVRVLRVGLGPDLNATSGTDDGIILRPPGADPSTTAGSIFPSGLNNALSFDVGSDLADFGNGDIILFLALTSANQVGNFSVASAVVDGDEANVNSASFLRDTFEILRREQGPVSPRPPE